MTFSMQQRRKNSGVALRVNERSRGWSYSEDLVSSYETESYVCRWETDACLIKAAVFGQQWKNIGSFTIKIDTGMPSI